MTLKNHSHTFEDDDNYYHVPELPPLSELEVGRMVTPPPAWATEHVNIINKLKRPGRPVITGGIGAGKSVVAEMFMEQGAGHIDFDRLARRVLEPGTSGFDSAVALLGTKVVSKGKLDRPKIAAMVYADEEIRKRLEAIVHPRVWLMMNKELDNTSDHEMVVISIPLLFEVGLETFFNPIILIYAEPEIRLKRLLTRSDTPDESIAHRIMAVQWPDPPKIMGSHYVIHNNGQLAETRRQVYKIYTEVIKKGRHS